MEIKAFVVLPYTLTAYVTGDDKNDAAGCFWAADEHRSSTNKYQAEFFDASARYFALVETDVAVLVSFCTPALLSSDKYQY